MLSGIRFVIDEHAYKAAVQNHLKEHGDLWEDFYDVLLAQTRVAEPRESLEDVRRRLTEQGKLRDSPPARRVPLGSAMARVDSGESCGHISDKLGNQFA